MATGCLHPSQKTTSLYLIITYPDHIDTAYPNASMPPRFADRYAHVYFHAIRSIYPSAERLGVEIGSRWRAVFSILPKNQDWEWILKTISLAAMFPFPVPVPGTRTETWVSFYNVGTKRSCFRNVEHGNGNVGHVPVPRLLRAELT